MPTLFRLLTILALFALMIYGIMAALVYFVQPTRSELTIDVPLPPLRQIERPAPAPEPEAGSEPVSPSGGGEGEGAPVSGANGNAPE
ncbi:hypothetical protein DYI37_13245 [Fulvimarina endophytica]|uniref:Histidine kinase n=1 Tax=Fulvimarina endophytica TaxID=2293836 RepID=A0A371X117_9HYPH|nr:hypothetical protein [Fulvimarina endophytica]RFC62915.1 hypothetical protein DYI37_13245 [Fulvimarina endophytica]